MCASIFIHEGWNCLLGAILPDSVQLVCLVINYDKIILPSDTDVPESILSVILLS